ncbi:MAG: hypothetical protein WBA59_01510 [Moheibacter sp.]
MKQNIGPLFKNRLDSPQKAPDGAWDYIRERLPSDDDKPVIPFWKKTLGIAVLLTGLVGGGLLIGNKDHSAANADGNSGIVQNQTGEQNSSVQNQSGNSVTGGIQENSSTGGFEESENGFGNESQNLIQNGFNSGNFAIRNSNQNRNQLNLYAQNGLNGNFAGNSNSDGKSFHQVLTGDYSSAPAKTFAWNPEFDLISNSVLLNEINSNNEKLIVANFDTKSAKSNEKKKKSYKSFENLYVSGFVSPTGLNTFVGSSMLSNNLDDYKTENSITLAYGLKAAYSLNPKLKIRTGVSVVGFEQITKNVLMTTGFSDSPNSFTGSGNNINYSGELRLYNPAEGGELNYRLSDGDVQQQAQFVEIPIEAEYGVFQTETIGISVTGGGSAWLLSKNKIYAHMNGYTEELGTANNINKTSFSANAGLKFDLKISDGVQLNVEPNFKYLLNPVSNIDKYSPYTVGVNAGVTVKLK